MFSQLFLDPAASPKPPAGEALFSPIEKLNCALEHVTFCDLEHETFNTGVTSLSYTNMKTHTHINVWKDKWMTGNGRNWSINTSDSYIFHTMYVL